MKRPAKKSVVTFSSLCVAIRRYMVGQGQTTMGRRTLVCLRPAGTRSVSVSTREAYESQHPGEICASISRQRDGSQRLPTFVLRDVITLVFHSHHGSLPIGQSVSLNLLLFRVAFSDWKETGGLAGVDELGSHILKYRRACVALSSTCIIFTLSTACVLPLVPVRSAIKIWHLDGPSAKCSGLLLRTCGLSPSSR